MKTKAQIGMMQITEWELKYKGFQEALCIEHERPVENNGQGKNIAGYSMTGMGWEKNTSKPMSNSSLTNPSLFPFL